MGISVEADLHLVLSPLKQEITVTATGREELAFESVPSVSIMDSFDLSEAMSTSIGEVLDGELGVAKRSLGVGSARPVLRGFDGDRVLIMEDGVRTGSLGSSSGDHGEPIDVSSLEKVEILKGPATLLYGSNAIGGVVNAVSSHEEMLQRPHPGIRAQVLTAFGSNNNQAGGSFNLDYGNKNWRLWLGGGGQKTGNYSAPTGKIEGSKSRISNGFIGGSWYSDNAFISFGYKANDGRSGIPFAGLLHKHHEEHHEEEHHEEEHEGEHEEGHEELDGADVAFRRNNFRFTGAIRNMRSIFDSFKLTLSYTDFDQDEIEKHKDGEQELGTVFKNQQLIYRGVFQQSRRGALRGTLGFWGMTRDYIPKGKEALSPPLFKKAFAVFVLEELEYDHVKVQFGFRAERTMYTPRPLNASSRKFVDRTFTGFSGGIGARFDLWPGAALVANYTNSFRAPALEELYNSGPHFGNQTYEIGNQDLKRERSDGVDIALRYQRSWINSELNVFYYDIDNFVFLAPTKKLRDGLVEAAYKQGDSRFLGSEVSLNLRLHDYIWLNLGLDLVDSNLRPTGGPLPRIPPLRGSVGLDWRYKNMSVRPELIMRDSRKDIFSTETPTAGHSIFNLKAAYTIPQQHFAHHLSINFFNIGNRLYRNHLSFIKDLAPEIGRGIRFSYAVKFF